MAKPEFSLTFEYGGKRFTDAARGLNAFADAVYVPLDDLGPEVKKVFKDILDTVADAMKQRHSDGWSPTRKGPLGDRAGRLAKRSGKMVKSIQRSVKVKRLNKKEVIGAIGGNVAARTHERGAVIRPRKKKFLAIPLPAALDSRGVPKKTKARDWPNLFVVTSKKGNLLLVRKKGAGIEPMYLLTKKAVIPRRLGLQATLTKAAPTFNDLLFDLIVRKIQKSISS